MLEALIETAAVYIRPAVDVGADAEYVIQCNHEPSLELTAAARG
jgi:hypothetical protein